MYANYERLRVRQLERYETFKHPVRLSTVCQALGCRRAFGRKGCCFCTEGCNDNHALGCCYQNLERSKKDDPFPPHPYPDIDDDNDAARILQTVLGNPPENVLYRRWEFDRATGKYAVEQYPKTRGKESTGLNSPEPVSGLDSIEQQYNETPEP